MSQFSNHYYDQPIARGLPGPVNVVELRGGRVMIGHGDRYKTTYQQASRSFEEEVADLERRYVTERRVSYDGLKVSEIRVVAVALKK